jgi:hypothetical protein
MDTILFDISQSLEDPNIRASLIQSIHESGSAKQVHDFIRKSAKRNVLLRPSASNSSPRRSANASMPIVTSFTAMLASGEWVSR